MLTSWVDKRMRGPARIVLSTMGGGAWGSWALGPTGRGSSGPAQVPAGCVDRHLKLVALGGRGQPTSQDSEIDWVLVMAPMAWFPGWMGLQERRLNTAIWATNLAGAQGKKIRNKGPKGRGIGGWGYSFESCPLRRVSPRSYFSHGSCMRPRTTLLADL